MATYSFAAKHFMDEPVTRFRIKLTQEDYQAMRVVCAVDSQNYGSICRKALFWCIDNRPDIRPLSYRRDAVYRSFFLDDACLDAIRTLETEWQCSSNTCLYTAIVHYLESRIEVQDGQGIKCQSA